MQVIKWLFLGLGIFLLGVNIVGEFKSLRNPDIYTENSRLLITDVEIEYEDLIQEISRKSGESDEEFALRVNDLIYRGMLYYWHREGSKKYHLSVPFWENYVLYIRNSIKSIDRYEFRSWEKNLERGVGLCSAFSNVVHGILVENGIEARLWGMTRHIVVEAKVGDDQWVVLDPNYGLYIPHSMQEIQADPELVRAVYQDMADLHEEETYKDPYTTDLMVEIFGYEDHFVWNPDAGFENFSYTTKWILPILFLLAGGIMIWKDKSGSSEIVSKSGLKAQ